MSEQILFIVRLNPLAQLPKYCTPGAAGADLYAVENCVVPARGMNTE